MINLVKKRANIRTGIILALSSLLCLCLNMSGTLPQSSSTPPIKSNMVRVNKRTGKQRRPLRVFLLRHNARCGCFRPAWENKQSLERKSSCAQTQVLPPHQAPSSALSRTNTQLIPNTSNVIIRSLSMCWSLFLSRRLSQQKTCLKFWFVNLILMDFLSQLFRQLHTSNLD